MKSLFDDLFEGMEAIGALMEKYIDPEEEKEGQDVYDLEDELEKEMSEEMREKFLKIMCMRGEKEREEQKRIFERGVRLGMQLMLDAVIERETRKK